MLTDDRLRAYVARRRELLEHIRDVLVTDMRVSVPPEQIDPDTPLFGTGLALDSIDVVDLIVGIERRLGVRMQDDEAGRLALRSINMTINYLLAAGDELP